MDYDEATVRAVLAFVQEMMANEPGVNASLRQVERKLGSMLPPIKGRFTIPLESSIAG